MAEFAAVASPAELAEQGRRLGWPVVLKARRNGSDGKGKFTVRAEGEIAEAWQTLGGDRQELYVEAFCPYVSELAVIITRSTDGSVAEYPVVETIQRNHICHVVKAPAAVMVNLLGAGPGSGAPLGIERALTIPGGHVHVYGKATSSAGRKMGHVTALGASLAAAEATARQTAEAIQFGTKL